MKTHKEINNRNTVTSFYRTIDSANPDISQIAGASNIYIGNHEDAPKTADFVIEEDIHTKTLESNNNTYYIEDAIEASLVNFEIDGKSTQETTTGKNKWSLASSYTTATGSRWILGDTALIVPAGTYTFSYVLQVGVQLQINVKTSSGTKELYTGANDRHKTFTLTEPSTTFAIYMGGSVANTISNIQLEAGSTATSYEPYTGGIASPNPDYPQDIEVIDGYNLFDEEYELGTINYYTGALENSSTIIRTKNYQKIQPSTSYSITLPTEVTGIILYYYNNGVFVRAVQPSISNHTVSFTTLSTANQVKWRFNSNYITLENQTMLVKGSQASPYLPYGSIAVKCEGKNLLKLNSSNLTFNRYIGNDGTYKTSTSGNYYASEEYLDFSNYKGNNITISNGLEIAFYTSNKTFISYVGRLLPRTQQVPNNCGFIRIDCYKDNINTMQIEKGSTATTYEEYKSNTMQIALQNNFIGKLPNGVKDELQVLNGNVILTKRVGKVVFNGSESWRNDAGTVGDDYRHNIKFQDIQLPNSATRRNGLSNYFHSDYITRDGIWGKGEFYCNGEWIVIWDKNQNYNLNNFKTWLSTHPTEVIYQLAEKQTINLGPINFQMAEGVNNIEVLANLSSFDTTLTYQIAPNARLFKRQEDGTLKEVFANEN